MATYNGERYISEAIESVLNQSYTNFEFIIVDDGSTDTTAQIIASFSDSRIIYLKKNTNSGIADSLNLGISKARGAYIARMDDDDVCMPNRFEEQLKAFEQDNDLIFCGSNVSGNDGEPLRTPENHDDILLELLFRNPIFHPTAIIRKEFLLGESYNINSVPSEDYDLWSRLIFKGKFYQFQKPLLYCRVHADSVTMNRRKEQLLKNVAIAKSMFSKHGFTNLLNHNEHLRIFASYDYSISGKTLKDFISWFGSLKQLNLDRKVFPIKQFNEFADSYLQKYLTLYFTNRILSKKIFPFFSINFRYKLYIVRYYFKKLIKKS